MSTSSTKTPLIVETRRGPCIAGTRITVFSVMDYLKGERSRDFIKHVMGISDAQLDAVLEYIALHKEAVEQEYTAIVRRSEERRAHYDKIFHERSPFPPDMSLEERVARMRQRLAEKRHASP
jgi:uncharacterized protein (DUF433 family)